MARMAHLLNILGDDLWDRLQDNNIQNLLELGVHIAVVVRTLLYLHVLFIFYIFLPQLNLFSLFLFQNTLSLFRHHVVMVQQEKILKAKVAKWDKAFQNATSLAEATSRKQAIQISKLETSVRKLRSAKKFVEEEAKKEKASAEEAARTIEDLKKALDMARVAEEEAKKEKIDLESRVDCLEVRVKMADDLLVPVLY